MSEHFYGKQYYLTPMLLSRMDTSGSADLPNSDAIHNVNRFRFDLPVSVVEEIVVSKHMPLNLQNLSCNWKALCFA
jgi:hypothetical protein